MQRFPTFLALVAALGLVGATLACADESATETKKPDPLAIGAKAPALVLKDSDGHAFDLHDSGVTRKAAEAVVLAQAAKAGVKEPAATTKLASIEALVDDNGDLDAAKVAAMANACGTHFGMVATEESVAGLQTLGQLVDWCASANGKPILFMTFSPNCGSVKRQHDQILEMAAKGTVRLYAIGCNTRDTDENLASFRDDHGWPVRVFWDRDQRVTDLIGGKVTPHFFLFDAGGVLRYRGAMNNDPMGFMDEEERKDYILDAAAAIAAGTEVATSETEPSG